VNNLAEKEPAVVDKMELKLRRWLHGLEMG